MRSAHPKVVHRLAGRPLIGHVLVAAAEAGVTDIMLVLSPDASEVQAAIESVTDNRRGGLSLTITTAIQAHQRGTGDAIRSAADFLDHAGKPSDTVLVLSGDMPLITPETLRTLVATHTQTKATLTLLSARVADPRGYGRVIRNGRDRIEAVREQKELRPQEEKITEINCGVYCADSAWLRRAVASLKAHEDGEYYLPDVVPLALADGSVSALVLPSTVEAQGINTRIQLAEAEKIMRRRINERHMEAGVTISDPETTYIEPDVAIGGDTEILPGTRLQGQTVIGSDCVIGPETEIVDSVVADGARIARSVIEGAQIGPHCEIGPFAHVRPGTVLHKGVRLGNHTEVKNSTIGAGSAIHHFSYIGDTTMGANVNIGAGTVTANYDGTDKHRTIIGDNVFVGSGTMLRAPVRLGNGSKTGAGAVVLRDVADDATVVGVPAREIGAESPLLDRG